MELEVLGMRGRTSTTEQQPSPKFFLHWRLQSNSGIWDRLVGTACACGSAPVGGPPALVKVVRGWCHADPHGACALHCLTTSLSFVMLMGSPLERGNRGGLCLDAGVVVPVGFHAAPKVLPAVLCLHEIVALIALPWLEFLKPLSFSPTPLVHRINSFLNTCGWSRTYGLGFKCNSPVDPLQFLKIIFSITTDFVLQRGIQRTGKV